MSVIETFESLIDLTSEPCSLIPTTNVSTKKYSNLTFLLTIFTLDFIETNIVNFI